MTRLCARLDEVWTFSWQVLLNQLTGSIVLFTMLWSRCKRLYNSCRLSSSPVFTLSKLLRWWGRCVSISFMRCIPWPECVGAGYFSLNKTFCLYYPSPSKHSSVIPSTLHSGPSFLLQHFLVMSQTIVSLLSAGRKQESGPIPGLDYNKAWKTLISIVNRTPRTLVTKGYCHQRESNIPCVPGLTFRTTHDSLWCTTMEQTTLDILASMMLIWLHSFVSVQVR